MSRLQLRFRLGSIPVRVDPGFWLITLVLFSRLGDPKGIGLAMLLAFVAVLTHELGHALAARAFGASPEIMLYSMGGLTRYAAPGHRPYGRMQSIVTSFAGPLAGFILALATFSCVVALTTGGTIAQRAAAIGKLAHNHLLTGNPSADLATLALSLTLYINLGWGVINLLPILPLDGGNIIRALLAGSDPDSGTVRALWVSVVVGPLVALHFYARGQWLTAMLFAYFVASTVRQLIELRRVSADRKTGLHARLEDAQQSLISGDVDRAETQARAVIDLAVSPVVRRTGVHMLAVARLQRGDARSALDVLRQLADTETDPFLLGATLLACGRADDAIPYLERAVRAGNHGDAAELLERARRLSHAWSTRMPQDPPA